MLTDAAVVQPILAGPSMEDISQTEPKEKYNPFVLKKKQLATTTNKKLEEMNEGEGEHRTSSIFKKKRGNIVKDKRMASAQRPQSTTGAGALIAGMSKYVSKSLERK